jgi:hypothetical protein
MLYDLLNHPLGDFHPRKIPLTSGLAEQKLRNLSGFGKWWLQCLIDGALLQHDHSAVNEQWLTKETGVLGDALYEDYVRSCDRQRLRPLSKSEMGKELKKYLPKGYPDKRRLSRFSKYTDSRGKEVGVFGAQQCYVLPSRGACIASFEQRLNVKLGVADDARPTDTNDDLPF